MASLACPLLAGTTFISTPKATPKTSFNPTLAVSAALPMLTMLAEDAEAKYGDSRRWSAVLVPLTTLVLPGIVAGTFTLWVFSDECWWQRNPDSKRYKEEVKRWKDFAITSNAKDPFTDWSTRMISNRVLLRHGRKQSQLVARSMRKRS